MRKQNVTCSDNTTETNDKITPARAMKLLAEDGVIVSEAEVKIILEFVYEMAEITVDQYLKSSKEKINY